MKNFSSFVQTHMQQAFAWQQVHFIFIQTKSEYLWPLCEYSIHNIPNMTTAIDSTYRVSRFGTLDTFI